ncbi:type I-E CRISPR-associated protein Cse2/CasB [Dactylosporangium sp. NPDC049140]|uniref:type I-E CRISPR-associated protein Cse2/CasB n=1 Tax=Dactylosporangium sp. NPDC049140 TaxID=3155647 RepID=UPI00340EB78C
MTTATADQARRVPPRRRRELGEHVARTVGTLQAQVLSDPPRPDAVAALARLRRGIGQAPGFDYTLEAYLWVPEALLSRRPADRADDAEQAVHDAVTLYALHQQSRRERMHVGGQGLGFAVAGLVRASDGPDGVRRRFAALGTASTYAESIYHLRGLITMLRTHQLPLDYGLLADDLCALRRPKGRTDTQAMWGREFIRNRPGTAEGTESTTDTSEESQA